MDATKAALLALKEANADGYELMCRSLCPETFDLSGGGWQDKCPKASGMCDFRPPFCRDCWAEAVNK